MMLGNDPRNGSNVYTEWIYWKLNLGKDSRKHESVVYKSVFRVQQTFIQSLLKSLNVYC